MSLFDRLEALRPTRKSKNFQNQYIGDLKGYNTTKRYEKGHKEILADSNFIKSYSSLIEPHQEEGEYTAITVDPAELNNLHREEKNRQIEEHPGGFDVGYSVDYNFGVALGKAANNEVFQEVDGGEPVRTVENVLRYRPAMYHATSAKVMKDGVVEWEEVIEDLEGKL